MNKTAETNTCYFCGSPATSNDHLPPDNTFPDPKPLNLITVPSCDAHNTEQSKDDEYFGVIIKTASVNSPIAQAMINDKVVRGFKRRPGFVRSLLNKSRFVELITPSGVIVGTAPAIEYKQERIATVVTRMTKGFFFKCCGQRLPDDYEIIVYPINPPLDEVKRYFLGQMPLNDFAPGIFGFKYQHDIDDPFFSAWFFMFYEETLLVSLTKKKQINNNNQKLQAV